MALNGDANVRTPLLTGVSTTLPTSGTGSVVLPSSTVLEPPNERRSRWWSIRVMYMTMFMSAVTFTVTFSTIWPFLQVVDSSATPSFLGWVVAGYSLGQLIASPLFGAWSARQSARQPLLCSMVLQVGSNLFYAYVQSIPANGGGCLILARILMGFGAGNAAVVRAYVSAATTVEERTSTMSKVSLFQSVGFILGPIIQTALVYVGYPGPVEKSWLHFNMYTSPAFLAAFFTIVNFVLILLFFRLHTVSDSTVINTTLHQHDDDDDEEDEEEEEEKEEEGGREVDGERGRQACDCCLAPEGKKGRPDYRAVGLSVYLFFITFFVFTIFETIGTALTMDMYGWSKEEASKYIGYILGGAGCIAIVVFLVVATLAKRGKDERIILIIGFLMCLVGFFCYVSWGHDLPSMSYAPIRKPSTLPPNSTQHSTLHLVSDRTANSSLVTTMLPTTAFNNWTTVSNSSHWTTVSNSSHWTTVANSSHWTTVSNSSHWTTVSNSSHWTTVSTMSSTAAESTTTSVHSHTFNVTTTPSNWSSESPPTTTPQPSTKSTEEPDASNGCPWYFAWCGRVPKIQLWQFLLGTFFISIGYPICNAMTYSIYSKVLGDKPQGLWMGIITSSGSLARMLGPIFVAQVYDSFGPRVTFSCTCVILAITLVVNIVGWRRLVPFDESPYRRRATGRHVGRGGEIRNGVGAAKGSLQ